MKTFLLALATLFLVSCDNQQSSDPTSASTDSTKVLSIIAQDGKRRDFKIELAITSQQQIHGLMNRTEMPKNAGMLFVFPDEAERSFWMKDTLIPLDMLFIQKDGTIHHIHENAVPNDLTSIPSNGPVTAVLELNGGAAREFGIHEGDKAHHVFFGNELR